VTVCPQGVGNSWNAGACCAGNTQDDVGFARGVVDYVTNAIDVPADRIYTTGFSNGGMLSYRLACEASDVFHGAAPAGGSYYGNQLGSFSCNPSTKLPILHGHGTLDTLQPFVAARNSYERYAEGIQGCPSQDSIIYSNPAYFGMSCRERSPCDGGTASTFCTYTGMGHIWPANFLLRAINYFTTGSLEGDGSTPPEPPQDPPSVTCDQCSTVHGSPDACGCGHCGSFGACTFSCDPTASLYSGTPCE
jgi:polyhydroxybutyrate depolymerase